MSSASLFLALAVLSPVPSSVGPAAAAWAAVASEPPGGSAPGPLVEERGGGLARASWHVPLGASRLRPMCLAARTLHVLRGGRRGDPAAEDTVEGRAPAALRALAASSEARALRDAADTLYKRGKYDDAVDVYTRAIALDNCVQGGYGGRAAALLMSAKYGAALHDALRAVAADAAAGTKESCVQGQAQAPSRAVQGRADGIHARLLLGKTLLALGRGEEANLHFDRAAQACAGAGLSRRAALELEREARDGIKHARAYQGIVRKAFNNLYLTRDIFYLPIVGRWRSWRKGSSSRDDIDLPLGRSGLLCVVAGAQLACALPQARRRHRR